MLNVAMFFKRALSKQFIGEIFVFDIFVNLRRVTTNVLLILISPFICLCETEKYSMNWSVANMYIDTCEKYIRFKLGEQYCFLNFTMIMEVSVTCFQSSEITSI